PTLSRCGAPSMARSSQRLPRSRAALDATDEPEPDARLSVPLKDDPAKIGLSGRGDAGRRRGLDEEPVSFDPEVAPLLGAVPAFVPGHFNARDEVSWNESWNGTEQRRHFRVEGDRLLVETAPAPSITSPGQTDFRRIVFERDR